MAGPPRPTPVIRPSPRAQPGAASWPPPPSAAALVAVPAPGAAGPLQATQQRTVAPPRLVPAPASLRTLPGVSFTLTRHTRIVARPGSGTAGTYLAGILRRSTGYPLPVTAQRRLA